MSTTYRQLDVLKRTLPSYYYYDADHYERELRRIWHRQWLCIGRTTKLREAGDYKFVEIGDQSVVVTRTENGELRAFHNTCRHRGSILCDNVEGRFRRSRIVCPYHAWTYSLEGALVATPWRLESADFDASDFPLYQVAAGEWAGFAYLNLDDDAEPFQKSVLGDTPSRLSNWHLGNSVTAHSVEFDIECNWKVFWENFSECYHCPGVHPDLCRLVPQFRQGIATSNVIRPQDDETSPLVEGAVTWTTDGSTALPWFDGLTVPEQRAGQTFGVLWPSCYVVTHVDYARIVHMLPSGPERTRLSIDWMVPPETLEHADFSVDKLVEFADNVVREDGRACELNQRGLRSSRHHEGVLVPQEIFVYEFHEWVRAQLDEGAAHASA